MMYFKKIFNILSIVSCVCASQDKIRPVSTIGTPKMDMISDSVEAFSSSVLVSSDSLRSGKGVLFMDTAVSDWGTDSPAHEITSSCTAFINAFGDAAANYFRCAIQHARPLRFCENCVEEYLSAKSVYEYIMNGDSVDEEGHTSCATLILNSDRIQIIIRTNTSMEELWTDCACHNCFEHYSINNSTVEFSLSNTTKEFHHKAESTQQCFFNNSLIHVHDTDKKANVSAVCVECLHLYHEMNSFYDKMLDTYHNQVCMDVVDMMNSTRSQWSISYKCNSHPGPVWPVLILSGFFCLLPILFYSCNKIQGAKQQNKILKQRRLRDVMTSTGSINHVAGDTTSLTTTAGSTVPNTC